MNQQREMFAEASRRLFADGQKVMAATAQMPAVAEKAEHLTV
jgi:hypothetical protein